MVDDGVMNFSRTDAFYERCSVVVSAGCGEAILRHIERNKSIGFPIGCAVK